MLKDLISIIVPCFNEEAMLPIYYEEMYKIMGNSKLVDFELIFVLVYQEINYLYLEFVLDNLNHN